MLYNIYTIGEVPKWLKGLAWEASRSITRCEGSNPFFSAIKKDKVLIQRTICVKNLFSYVFTPI